MKRLMIVDDHKAERMLFEVIFEDTCEVISCENGREAMDQLMQQSVDLVVTDLHMPGMDGVQLTRTLRRQHPELPVIAVTANPEYFDLNENLTDLFDDVLAKPLNLDILERKVWQHMHAISTNPRFNTQ
jgi:two-component system response regulator AtoC